MNSVIYKKIKYLARYIYELFLKAGFILLDALLPKNEKYWCFCTWDNYPHTLDNPRAVFETIKNDASIRKIILVKTSNRLNFSDGKNIKFINAESFHGIYYVARSRIILLGYSLSALSSYSNLISNNHTIIQLWHGIPLKRIGMLFPDETNWYKETRKYYATVCSSSEDKNFMRQAFSPILEDNVWQSGLPRNDIILMNENNLPVDYHDYLRDFRNRIGNRKLVLYAPTWRAESENIYVFSGQQINTLNKVLEDNNAVLAIRGHSNVRSHDMVNGEILNSRIIEANSIPDVNILLRLADILVTDYSSIYIDFLITNKPIIYFTYDLDNYYKERGFLYNIKKAFASEEVLNFDDFVTTLDHTLRYGTEDTTRYQSVKKLFHDYEGSSSVAVAEHIRNI